MKGGLPVSGGDADSVPLVIDGDLTLLITKGAEQNVELEPSLPDILEAPVTAGEKVGSVGVVVDGRRVAELDIVTAQAVTATGLTHVLGRIVSLWVI